MRGVGLVLLLVATGCRTVTTGPALPVQHSVVRDQLVIYSDFPIATRHRLLDELAARRVDMSSELKLPPSDEPIHVYLFRSKDDFHRFIVEHYPEFPERRAFFVETDTRLAVYAHWGDRVAEDLRHEVAHGYLHASVPRLPLWLDEGLAEYYEVARNQHGRNAAHLEQLAAKIKKDRWQPDLARLEALDSAAEMSQLDYAQAWAWVYFMLTTDEAHRDALHRYLRSLREKGAVRPFSEVLGELHVEPNRTLADYIGSLE